MGAPDGPGHVGVDQLGLKQADDLARVQPVLIVRQIVDARLRGELPHVRYPRRPRAEPRLHEVAPHVGSSEEADLREKVRFDHEPRGCKPVAIAVVVEEAAVAEIVARSDYRLRASHVGIEAHVLIERERRVEAMAESRANTTRHGAIHDGHHHCVDI